MGRLRVANNSYLISYTAVLASSTEGLYSLSLASRLFKVRHSCTAMCIPTHIFFHTAIIVLRICYVYSKNQIVRIFLLSSFVVTTVATCAIYFVLIWPDVDPRQLGLPPGVVLRGCKAPPSGNMWKLFIPNLVYHTILYLTTTIPALRMRRIGKKSRLMDRLVVE